ncbi:MAG: hypothetical protein JWO02_1625 [Solirubrobacterales bacterium]|nr:hypothetical protein [Solirubrobacterales bacterium]
MSTLTPLLKNRASIAWLFLILATLLSWRLGTDHGLSSDDDHRLVSSVIVLVAFVKIRLVGLYFMELRDSPLPLRLVFEGYCLVVCAAVLGTFLAS